MSDLVTVDYIMFFIEIDRSSEPIACTWISASYFTKSYLEQTRRQVYGVWIRLSCDGLLPWKFRFFLFRFSKWLRTIGQDSVHYYHVNLWREQWPMLLQRLSFFFTSSQVIDCHAPLLTPGRHVSAVIRFVLENPRRSQLRAGNRNLQDDVTSWRSFLFQKQNQHVFFFNWYK